MPKIRPQSRDSLTAAPPRVSCGFAAWNVAQSKELD